MALSGTITGKADNTNYTLTCEWSATQSITNNTSTITAKVYLKAPSGWSTISSNWSCVINGTTVTTGKSATISSTKVLLGTRTWTVTHGSNGALSTSISFSYSNGLSSAGTYTTKKGSGSATITLDTIPRTSSFTLSNSPLNMGSSQIVTISRASSSFTHTVQYTFGSSTTTVATKSTATTISFTPPTSLASQVPNATSGTCTVKVTTYNGDTSIGSASKTFTLNVPSSIVPSVSVATTINNALGGLAIAGKSTVTVTPSGSGNTGSSISSYTYSGGGLSGTGSSKTTGTLSSGTHTFSVTAKDSRGRTVTASKSVTIYAYSNPVCSVSAFRANSSGVADPSGTYLRLKLNWTLSNPNNANTNTKKYTVYWKKTTDSSWSTYRTDTLSAYSGSATSWDAGSGWATTTSYDIKFTVTDSYGSASATCNVSTIAAILDIENGGVGIGKLHEQGKLDVNGAVYTSDRYYVVNNGKNAQLGTGTSDVFLHNSASGKYLQMKDDGTLSYSDALIYHSGNIGAISATGRRWGTVGTIGSDGVMEIGRYLDWHYTSGNTSDYTARWEVDSAGRVTMTGSIYSANGVSAKSGFWTDGTLNVTGVSTLTGNVFSNGAITSQRSGYQFRARPASEGQVIQYRFEDSSGNLKGYIGSPNGNYELHIQCETNNVLLRGNGIYCKNSANSAYVACYASAFTVGSEAKWKRNINPLEKSAMDIINQARIYEYDLKENPNARNIRKEIGLVIDYETPAEIITETEILDDSEWSEEEKFVPGKIKQIDKGVDLYAMASLAWKALQEQDEEIQEIKIMMKQLLETNKE